MLSMVADIGSVLENDTNGQGYLARILVKKIYDELGHILARNSSKHSEKNDWVVVTYQGQDRLVQAKYIGREPETKRGQ